MLISKMQNRVTEKTGSTPFDYKCFELYWRFFQFELSDNENERNGYNANSLTIQMKVYVREGEKRHLCHFVKHA